MPQLNDHQIHALFGMLSELIDRTKRLETRVVLLMQFVGCDKHGQPVDTTHHS